MAFLSSSLFSHKRRGRTRRERAFSLSLSLFLLSSLSLASFAMSSSTPPRVHPIDRPLPKGKAEVIERKERGFRKGRRKTG